MFRLSQGGGVQTKQSFSMKSILKSPILATGSLLLLCGDIHAQIDPFKKSSTQVSASGGTQPFTAETFQEVADRATPGVLGVAVYDFQTGSLQGVNMERSFPSMSVFKAFLAAEVLSRVDAGQLSLDKKITLAPEDIRDGLGSIDGSGGGTFTVQELLRAALIESDNSAADALLRLSGGPEKLTGWLRDKGLRGIRCDRDLRTQGREQSGIPQALSPGRNASTLRDKVGEESRRAAFESAKSDPRDTTTPEGAVRFLIALKKGELLSAASTNLLLGWLGEVKTGQSRLKAGFASQTALAHKTGTSSTYEGVTLATNDIGLATLPDGRMLAIAVFLGNAQGSDEARNGLIAACARVASKPSASQESNP
jgi:beta-lactamase class A